MAVMGMRWTLLATVLFVAPPALALPMPWDPPVGVLPETIQPVPLGNGGFDADFAHWSPFTLSLPDPNAYVAWSPLDHAGDLASGSLQFVNLVPNAGNTLARADDCFDLDGPLRAIRVRLRYHVPVGAGRLWVELWTGFEGDHTGACHGPGVWRQLGGPVGTTADFVEFDSGWFAAAGPIGSLVVGFLPYAPLPAYVAHVDDVRVDIATIATVFSDGLE